MAPSLILICIVYLLMVNTAQMTGLSVQQNSTFLGSFRSATVGDEITLPCSCDYVRNNSRLSWYKQRLGMKPTVITSFFDGEFHNNSRFTLGNDNDKVGKKDLHITDVRMSDSAVYHCISRRAHQIMFLESINLTVKDLNSEHWIHQPALWEQVLYGNGTRLNIKSETGADPIIYVLTGALVFTSVLVVVLAFSLCTLKKKDNSLSTVKHKARVSTSTYPNEEVQDQEEVDELHYATLTIRKPTRTEKNTAQADCVYSTLQQPN